MKDPIKIITSCKNQVCTPHIRRVAHNLNSNSCSLLYFIAVLLVKIQGTLTLVYILGYWLNKHPIETLN